MRLNLRHVEMMPFMAGVRQAEQLLSAYVEVDDLAALDAQFQAAGVPFLQALTKKPWGLFDLVVEDPDGNLICFASR